MAGDPNVPTMTLVVIDLASGRQVEMRTPRLPQLRPVMQSPQSGLFTSRNAQWHTDGKTVTGRRDHQGSKDDASVGR